MLDEGDPRDPTNLLLTDPLTDRPTHLPPYDGLFSHPPHAPCFRLPPLPLIQPCPLTLTFLYPYCNPFNSSSQEPQKCVFSHHNGTIPVFFFSLPSSPPQSGGFSGEFPSRLSPRTLLQSAPC